MIRPSRNWIRSHPDSHSTSLINELTDRQRSSQGAHTRAGTHSQTMGHTHTIAAHFIVDSLHVVFTLCTTALSCILQGELCVFSLYTIKRTAVQKKHESIQSTLVATVKIPSLCM